MDSANHGTNTSPLSGAGDCSSGLSAPIASRGFSGKSDPNCRWRYDRRYAQWLPPSDSPCRHRYAREDAGIRLAGKRVCWTAGVWQNCHGSFVGYRPVSAHPGRSDSADGRSLNRELVANGLAWHYKRFSADRELAMLEQEARAPHRGLWSDRHRMPPWEFRRIESRVPERNRLFAR